MAPGPTNGAGGGLGALLSRLGSEARLEEGEYLWREGDPCDAVAVLLEGALEVISTNPVNEDVMVLRVLKPETVLGEIACLDGGPRSASVRAATRSVVVRCPAAEFRTALRRRPSILEQLLLQQVETVRLLTAQVTQHHHRAITDQLTRLYNLGFFVERLGLELERAKKTGDALAVIMFDIDHFKRFNDNHGHQAGNEVLIRVAQTLRNIGRRGDIVARYGGEEFVALLYGASRDEAYAFAERVRRNVETADFAVATPPRCEWRITMSGGLACFPGDADDPNTLIKAADANLYEAKQRGRNTVIADLLA